MLAGHGAFRLYFRHYLTADGVISVGGLSGGLFAKFHAVTGLPPVDRANHDTPEFQAVVDEAEALFASKTTDEWLALLRQVGYPCGPYHLPFDALDDEQVRANDYVVDLEHPVFGSYTTTGMPVRFEKSTAAVSGPSPTLAAHSRQVLHEAGVSPERANALLAEGVVVDDADGAG